MLVVHMTVEMIFRNEEKIEQLDWNIDKTGVIVQAPSSPNT